MVVRFFREMAPVSVRVLDEHQFTFSKVCRWTSRTVDLSISRECHTLILINKIYFRPILDYCIEVNTIFRSRAWKTKWRPPSAKTTALHTKASWKVSLEVGCFLQLLDVSLNFFFQHLFHIQYHTFNSHSVVLFDVVLSN